MAREANKLGAVLLLFFLGATFFTVIFNIPPANLLNIAFSDIVSWQSGVWIIPLRLIIAPAVVLLSGYTIYKVVTD